MKDETTPVEAEAQPQVATPATSLLDIAKQRAQQRAEDKKVVAINKSSSKRKLDPEADDENLGARARKNTDIVKTILTLPEMPKRKRTLPWPRITFGLAVVLPTIVTALYFAFIASPQYLVETQFSVRGAGQMSMNALGLGALMGSSAETGDSYIVTDYIQSAQILPDIREQTGVDIRTIYSRPNIDFLYRENGERPLDEFRDYWRDMVNVSYNSTTGNVTMRVFAFSPADAKQVSQSILTASEHLVNTLADKSRRQVVEMANQQVARSEERLRNIRKQMTELRMNEQAVDPSAVATMEASIISSLEQELANLRTRYKALVDSISTEAPSARVIERQISALEAQLVEQKKRLTGDFDAPTDLKTARNGTDTSSALPEMIDRFTELQVEQEFAVKAYTASLAALEAAMQEAQKQERYFALYVPPREPEIALYPFSILNTGLVFLASISLWLIGYFVFRSVKDHAI